MLYCSGSMCVGVTVWLGWGGVVWYPYAVQAEALLQPATCLQVLSVSV